MKTILFPTDFSANASNAFAYAAALAGKFGSKLYILHTYQVPYHRSDMFLSLTDIMKKDAEEGIAKLLSEIRANPRYASLDIETVVRVGDVAEASSDFSEEFGIGMIVMGTTGASGLEEVFLGSNASAVISKSRVPVLCIPPAVMWKEPSEICFAYDMGDTPTLTLEPVRQISRAFNTHITVLYVNTDGETSDVASSTAKVKTLLGEIPHDFVTSDDSDVEEAIRKYSEKRNSDWIALVHHHRGFFGKIFNKSITSKVAFHTNLPLLALPDQPQ